MEKPQTNRSPLYQRIRTQIHAKNIPMRDVATMADIKVKRFYRLMDGKTRLYAEEVEQICNVDVLELDPVVLLCPPVPKK